jgi:hypothetical protein
MAKAADILGAIATLAVTLILLIKWPAMAVLASLSLIALIHGSDQGRAFLTLRKVGLASVILLLGVDLQFSNANFVGGLFEAAARPFFEGGDGYRETDMR